VVVDFCFFASSGWFESVRKIGLRRGTYLPWPSPPPQPSGWPRAVPCMLRLQTSPCPQIHYLLVLSPFESSSLPHVGDLACARRQPARGCLYTWAGGYKHSVRLQFFFTCLYLSDLGFFLLCELGLTFCVLHSVPNLVVFECMGVGLPLFL
jgi:hypothetical protein